MINSEHTENLDCISSCCCTVCKVETDWKQIIQPNYWDEEECRRKFIDFNVIQELIEEEEIIERGGVCCPCLDDLLEVYENEIQFVEESIEKYQEKLEQTKENTNTMIEKLEMNNLIEEEKSLQLLLHKLLIIEPVDKIDLTVCEEEETYWKEYFKKVSDMEEEIIEYNNAKSFNKKKERLRNKCANNFQINEKTTTISGISLLIQNGQDSSQIIENINSGWGLCVILLSFITKKMCQLPIIRTATTLEFIFEGGQSKILYKGNVYNDTYHLLLNERESTNFDNCLKLFFQILDHCCKNFARLFGSKIENRDNLSILEGKLDANYEKSLLFPDISIPNSIIRWNRAINRVITKLKVLQFYLFLLE